ncbi:MAG: division/cell wall cluster transcriptional repressor MraZ [Rhizobiaceae bacterium]
MDRFASSTINNVDKKGRVSIPAHFRSVLGGQNLLHVMFSVDHPVAEVGGPSMTEWYEKRLAEIDPLSEEYEIWAFHLLGDALYVKIDSEGRIPLDDRIREHTGITDKVLFEGRGLFFWLWEPGRYASYRTEARAKVRQLRRNLGSASGAPALAGRRADP